MVSELVSKYELHFNLNMGKRNEIKAIGNAKITGKITE